MAEAHTAQAHPESTRFYWIVGAILAVITVVEVVVTLVGLPDLLLLALLLVLSVVKGAAVVMFFMHLRGDARVFKLLLVAGLLLGTSMVLAMMALNSGHYGVAG